MGIWFVYRSPYDGILSKHVQRLDGADTLLGWFRSIWRAIPDRKQAVAHARALLGTHAYSFAYVFIQNAEEDRSPPATTDELHAALRSSLSHKYRGTDDTIQVATDDDEWAMALYWFTDDFARRHPERVAYLLREDWRLPEAVGPGGFPTPADAPRLYVVDLDLSEINDMADVGSLYVVPGLRLPDLVPWLLGHGEDEALDRIGSPGYRLQTALRELLDKGKGLEAGFRQALGDDPADAATWAAYSDWLADRDRPRAERYLLELAARAKVAAQGPSARSARVQVGQHCAAVIMPADPDDMFDQWFLFDDVWASGNADLANALIDYACRFNVLDGS